MNDFKAMLSAYNKLIVKSMLLSFLLFFACRIVFHIHNHSSFANLGLSEIISIYFYAILFDSSAIAITNILFIIIFFFPLPKKLRKNQLKVAGIFFIVFNAIAIGYNLFDTAYFPFSNKRLTIDMIDFGGDNGNLIKLIPKFLLDFWYLVLIEIIIVYFLIIWARKNIFNFSVYILKPPRIITVLTTFFTSLIFWCALSLLLFRGWFIRIPLSMVDAGKYTSVQNTPLLLNTVFTVVKSIGTDMIAEYHYFKNDEVIAIYNPISRPTGKSFNKRNIVLIIVESLSKEFMGSFSSLPTCTPFLDSLSNHSLVFTDAYANGKQSAQGIPAITGSVPSIMNGFFINTPYINNNYKGLGALLAGEGYYTAFMHGAHNGSMNFDAFAKQAGYKDYFGRKEYNDDKDFDGNWGIWDEEFLQFGAKKINEHKEPFHVAIFTLSSHNPYLIPQKHKKKFIRNSKNPLCKVVEYTDYSLQQFFNTAKQQSWYNNTIFVITADHTGESLHPFYSSTIRQYQIPVIIFDPQKNKYEKFSQTISQVDILPIILNKLNFPKNNFSFGNDAFLKQSFGVYYTNNQYQITQNGYFLSFDGTKSTALYHYANDSLLKNNLISKDTAINTKKHLETILKAYIQQYNYRVIKNKMMSD